MTNDGKPETAAQVSSLGDGRYAVVSGNRRFVAYGVADGDRVWVFVNGRTFVLDTEPRTRQRPREDEQASLAAPMPATVVSVSVSAGDRVTKGEVLVTLEAMKMELPVRAPRDGVVTNIACRAGDLVQPGAPLVTLE